MSEIITEIEIDAPHTEVWAYFSNSANWPSINGLLKHSTPGVPFVVGDTPKLTVDPKGSPPLRIKPKILVSEHGHLMWKGKVPGFWGKHYFKTESIDGGARTRWIHGEHFGGLLSRPLLMLIGPKLERAYREFNTDLARAIDARSAA